MIRMHKKRHFMLKSEINVVPLLDILLVLLLTFMVTTPIITQNIKVDLPHTTEHKKAVGISDSLIAIIEISGIEQYSILVDKDRINQLSFEKIAIELKHLIESNPKIFFLISGAKNVPYNEIIKVINLLHSIGIESIGLMTQLINLPHNM